MAVMADMNQVRTDAREKVIDILARIDQAGGESATFDIGLLKRALYRTHDDDLREDVADAAMAWFQSLAGGGYQELESRSQLAQAASVMWLHRS